MFMMRYILFLLLLAGPYCSLQAQNDSLAASISNADKIEIVSHQDLWLKATAEEMKLGISGHWRKLQDTLGQLNECILTERQQLNNTQRDILKRILAEKHPGDVPADKASCFVPHQAILIYLKNSCFIIDICFDCRQFSAQENLIGSNDFLTTDKQWADLKNFFISNGIKKGMVWQ